MFATPHFRSSRSAILALCALAATAVFPAAQAQTQITFDAQVPFSFSSPTLSGPLGIAVAPDGTVYLADVESSTTGQVVRITPPANGAVTGSARGAASLAATAVALTPSIAVKRPTAVALDSTGALYIADGTDGVVIKMAAPETSSAATLITYSGAENPTALATDSSNNLYIADNENQGAIFKYSVVGGAPTATELNLSGNVVKPVGLAVDSSGNVYFADARNNEVYLYTASTNSAAVYLTTASAGNFEFSSTTKYPIGMGFDPAGSLYILDNQTGNLTQVISPSTSNANVQLPLSSSLAPTGLAVSSIGNLYVSDDAANTADEVYYNNNPFNYGSVAADFNGTNALASPAVTVNFQFNTKARNVAIYQSMQGDASTEFNTQSGTCKGTKGSTCSMAFYVEYSSSFPGTRNGAVGLTDSAGDILAAPNTGIDLAGAMALYPGTQATLSQATQTLYEPEGLAVTGTGGTLFIADEGGLLVNGTFTFTHGAVWAYPATAGTPSGTPTKIGGFPTPTAVALDGTGNLYVADYGGTGTGSVTIVPVSSSNTWPGFGTALSFPAAAALTHPMALAFDPSGNLYIGDMGPGGVNASASNPGYIVKVPADGGPAIRLDYSVGGIPIVFPQALATDSQGNLYIADAGDGETDLGGVDVVSLATGTASAISFGSFAPLSQPSGLGFDAANDLYVLDSYNQRVLVVPVTFTGTVPAFDTGDISLLGQGLSGLTSAIVTPSNLVVWPQGQFITIGDLGFQPTSGTASPVQVLTLQSLNASVDASSGSVSLTGVNVGNEEITFANPSPTRTGTVNGGAAFSYTGCASSGNTLEPGIVPNCTNTVTYNGSGTAPQTAIFTLAGTSTLDGSALGNTITVSGSPEIPVGVFSGQGLQGSIFGTVTLTNTGLAPLNLTAISAKNTIGGITITGGSCSPITSLQQNGSCTVTFTFGNQFIDDATISITDNNLGQPGTVQTAAVSFFFGLGGLVVPANGSVLDLVPRNLQVKDTSDNVTSANVNTSPSSDSTTTKGGKKFHR
jgi:sugar lactone lactonase YvrE